MVKRIENWAKVGKVNVTRNAKGQFTGWKLIKSARATAPARKARFPVSGKPITRKQTKAERKTAKARRPPARNQTRIGPIEKAVAMYGGARRAGKTQTRRYEFIGGSGKERQKAVSIAKYHPPKQRHVTVRTLDYLKNPYLYSGGGDWVDSKVESK